MSIDKPVITFVAATIASVLGSVPHDANAADSRVERAMYLVAIMDGSVANRWRGRTKEFGRVSGPVMPARVRAPG